MDDDSLNEEYQNYQQNAQVLSTALSEEQSVETRQALADCFSFGGATASAATLGMAVGSLAAGLPVGPATAAVVGAFGWIGKLLDGNSQSNTEAPKK